MDQTVKERLVGMGVLLVLGVIFIPLILDGNISELKANTSQDLNLPVPSEGISHEMDFSDGNVRKLSLPLPSSDDEQNLKPEISPDNAAESKTNTVPASGFVDELPKNEFPKDKKDTTDAKSELSTTQSAAQTLSTQPKGSIKRSASTTSTTAAGTKSETGLQTSTALQENTGISAASAWVVQIGSFGNRDNAEKEVASLKTKGFPAFVRRFVTSEDKVLYRVRIGPEKDRTRAEKLSERLSKAGIKGQIVADP